ncbi:MAG: tetratricopeptide repeat protein [Phycisphaerales bacterium]
MRLSRRAKRRALVLAVVIGVGVCGIWGWRVIRTAQIERLVTEARIQGMEAYSDGHYETALGRLSYYLTYRKRDLEVLLAFADARSKVPSVNNGHLREAVQRYQAVLRVHSENREALEHLLVLYRRFGHRVEGADVADRIIALEPEHIDAWSMKAAAAFQQGRLKQTADIARKLCKLEPRKIGWRVLYVKCLQRQDVSERAVLDVCDEWIAEDERDGRFRLLKVEVLAGYGHLQQAKEELVEAVKLGADSQEVLEAMVEILELMGLRELAEELLVEERSKFPNEPWVFETAIRRLWQALRIEDALEVLAQAEEAFGDTQMNLLRWRALLHTVGGERDEANKALEKLSSLAEASGSADRDASRGWVEAIRASQYVSESNWLDALASYERALALEPNDAVLQYLLAKAYHGVGEHDLALSILERAERLDPHWMAIQLAQAESFLALGRHAEAFEDLRKVIRRAPNAGLRAYLLLAKAWLAFDSAPDQVGLADPGFERESDVLKLLLALDEQFPLHAEILSLLAEAYLRRGDSDNAVALIERVLRDDQTDVRTLTRLAEISQQWELSYEQRLLARSGERSGLTLALAGRQARILMHLGRADEAYALVDRTFATVADRSHTAVQAQLIRTQLMLVEGDEKALAGIAQLLAHEPNSLAAAEFALGQEEAWKDAAIIRAAIDTLSRTVGDHSPRAMLAEATYRYRFQRDDPASIAHATGLVRDVLQRTPDSKHALTLMASLLVAGEDARPEIAIQHLKRAINLYPSDVTLYPRLISLSQKVGDLGEAGQYLKRLASRPYRDSAIRRAELQLLLAQVDLAPGDLKTCIARISQLVDETSDESEQLPLASLYLRAGRYDDAEQIYTRLLASPERSEMAVRRAADFYAQRGRFHKGLALLQALEIDGDSASKLLMLGLFHQDHGDLDEAGRFFQRAVEISPGSTEAWNRLAVNYLAIGSPDDARQAALRGLEVDSKNGALLTTLAIASISTNGTTREEALRLIKTLGREHEPLRATLRLLVQAKDDRGALAPTAGDLVDAQQLVLDHPSFLPAWQLSVMLHVQSGRVDEAVGLANRAAARLPNDPRPAEWAARMLFDAGRLDESVYAAQTWRRRSFVRVIGPDTFIASVHLELGSPASAVKRLAPHVDRIWDQRARFPDQVMLWLRALLLGGQIDHAALLIQQLASEAQRWHNQLLALALVLEDNSCYELLELIEPVLTETPEGTVMLAKAWADLGRRADDPSYYERGENLANTAESAGAPIVQVHLLRATIASYRGDLPATELHYGKVLELQPRHVVALNNLAYALIQLAGKYNEAAALALRAIKIDPGNPGVLDTYAQALIGLDRLDEAERNARLAVSARPNDPDLRLTLVECLIGQSRFDGAEVELAVARGAAAKAPGADRAVAARIEQIQQRLDQARPVVEQRATTIGLSER